MDPVHDWTDGELERLERAMAREYGQAVREMRSKLDKFLKGYERELSQRLKALDDTPEAAEALEAWKRDRAADRRYLRGMVDALSADLEHAQERAMALLEDRVPQIYAENANYGAFEVDRAASVDTAFNLMDEDTARQLIGGGGALFEPPRPDAAKVRAWTDRKLTSAVTQGILQGESIPHIARRVKSVARMSASAAVRTARTACTGAENAGRVSSYQRAERLGISLRQEWLATLDGRTRDSHRVLDGERVAVGEEFSNGLRFPGDPQGPGREVYNCRCTLVAAIDGIDQSAAARFDRLPDSMSYDDWKQRARDRMESGASTSDDVIAPNNSTWVDGDGGFRVFDQGGSKWDGDQAYYFDQYFDEESGRYRLQKVYGGDRSLEEVNERAVGFDWWNDKTTEAERKVIESYQNSSASINGQLRAGEVTSANATKIRKMEHALDEAEVGVPFVCQREANSALLGLDRQASVEEIRGMVGERVTDKGFMSCSPTSRDDFKFGDNTARGMGTTEADRVQYHIQVPEGKGIGGLVGTHSMMVDEFILNRGSVLEVMGAYEVDGVVHCNLRYVGRRVDPLVVKKKPKK